MNRRAMLATVGAVTGAIAGCLDVVPSGVVYAVDETGAAGSNTTTRRRWNRTSGKQTLRIRSRRVISSQPSIEPLRAVGDDL